MNDDLKRELKQYLIQDLRLEGVRPEEITDEAPLFVEGLGLDSLDAVELVVIIQKRFGVAVRDMEEAKRVFVSIDALAEFIVASRAAG
ncbi:MAG: phosphopantetheine-binding protein [Candidatus Adiutrix sp.]|nr:phosphopantetheine-binding protein [Candidatus Adiutrix sp.]